MDHFFLSFPYNLMRFEMPTSQEWHFLGSLGFAGMHTCAEKPLSIAAYPWKKRSHRCAAQSVCTAHLWHHALHGMQAQEPHKENKSHNHGFSTTQTTPEVNRPLLKCSWVATWKGLIGLILWVSNMQLMDHRLSTVAIKNSRCLAALFFYYSVRSATTAHCCCSKQYLEGVNQPSS